MIKMRKLFVTRWKSCFKSLKAEKYKKKKKKMRIFNQFILFDDLCDFIKEIEREYLLYF